MKHGAVLQSVSCVCDKVCVGASKWVIEYVWLSSLSLSVSLSLSALYFSHITISSHTRYLIGIMCPGLRGGSKNAIKHNVSNRCGPPQRFSPLNECFLCWPSCVAVCRCICEEQTGFQLEVSCYTVYIPNNLTQKVQRVPSLFLCPSLILCLSAVNEHWGFYCVHCAV